MDLKRGLSAGQLAAIAGESFYPVVFVWLDWPDAVVRCHSAVGTLTWGGYDWTGVGDAGQVGVPEEVVDIVASAATVGLIKSPTDLEALLDDVIRNRSGAIYMGWLDARPGTTGAALIGTPIEIFSGYMDGREASVERIEEGYFHGMQIQLGSGPSVRADASVFHSDEDQRRLHPADTAGQHLLFALAKVERMIW